MYTPINLDVYIAAFSGAMASMSNPIGTDIINPATISYLSQANIADAWAQAVDIAWGSATPANNYVIECIQSLSTIYHGGHPTSGPANWTTTARAVVAAVQRGQTTITGQGIIPPNPSTVPGITIGPLVTGSMNLINQSLVKAAAQGKPLYLEKGDYNTEGIDLVAQSNTIIVAEPGVRFYSSVVTPRLLLFATLAYINHTDSTTTVAAFTQYTNQISLNAAPAIGDYLIASVGVYTVTNVAGGGPFTVTVNRPIRWVINPGDNVYYGPSSHMLHDVTLFGNGMQVDCANCTAWPFNIMGFENFFADNIQVINGGVPPEGIQFDGGCYHCAFKNVRSNGGSIGAYGSEDILFEQCKSLENTTGAIADAIVMGTVIDGLALRCTGLKAVGSAINITTWGAPNISVNCRAIGHSGIQCGAGVTIASSRDCEASGEFERCTVGCTMGNTVSGTIKVDISAINCTAGMTINSPNACVEGTLHVLSPTQGGLFVTDGLVNLKGEIDSSSVSHPNIQTAGGQLFWKGKAIARSAGLYALALGGGILYYQGNLAINGANWGGFIAAGGTLYLSNTTSAGAVGGVGIWNQAGVLRINENVNLSTFATPFQLDPGSFCNIGSVTLDVGGATVDYNFPVLADPADPVTLTRFTAGGAAGVAPTFTKTPGTRVSVTGSVGDTSVYRIKIG